MGSSFVEGGWYLYYFTFGSIESCTRALAASSKKISAVCEPISPFYARWTVTTWPKCSKCCNQREYSFITLMSGGHQSRKACRNEIANVLNGSPTTFERSILRLKPSSPSYSRPLPWSEAESEL